MRQCDGTDTAAGAGTDDDDDEVDEEEEEDGAEAGWSKTTGRST
jgi:hypothetical protein